VATVPEAIKLPGDVCDGAELLEVLAASTIIAATTPPPGADGSAAFIDAPGGAGDLKGLLADAAACAAKIKQSGRCVTGTVCSNGGNATSATRRLEDSAEEPDVMSDGVDRRLLSGNITSSMETTPTSQFTPTPVFVEVPITTTTPAPIDRESVVMDVYPGMKFRLIVESDQVHLK